MYNPLISNNFFNFCIIRNAEYTAEDVIDEIIDHFILLQLELQYNQNAGTKYRNSKLYYYRKLT